MSKKTLLFFSMLLLCLVSVYSEPVAADGQTLSSQPADVQANFKNAFKENAEIRWVMEHNIEIGRSDANAGLVVPPLPGTSGGTSGTTGSPTGPAGTGAATGPNASGITVSAPTGTNSTYNGNEPKFFAWPDTVDVTPLGNDEYEFSVTPRYATPNLLAVHVRSYVEIEGQQQSDIFMSNLPQDSNFPRPALKFKVKATPPKDVVVKVFAETDKWMKPYYTALGERTISFALPSATSAGPGSNPGTSGGTTSVSSLLGTPSAPASSGSFGSLSINGSPTSSPQNNPDSNLAVRGYSSTSATKGLIDMGGATDSKAPQLANLFSDKRVPRFSGVYRVNDWDWNSNSKGGPVSAYEVTLAGFAVSPGESIHTPGSGYDIGQGYTALVIYAEKNRITIKYTREDNVVSGYTIHVEGISVDSGLLDLYNQLNSSGRGSLPALKPGQVFGSASGNEIKVAIRDTGCFMDPRVRKDWWAGR